MIPFENIFRQQDQLMRANAINQRLRRRSMKSRITVLDIASVMSLPFVSRAVLIGVFVESFLREFIDVFAGITQMPQQIPWALGNILAD